MPNAGAGVCFEPGTAPLRGRQPRLRLPPEVEDLRLRVRAFVDTHILPVEADRGTWDAHDNIRLDALEPLRARAKAEGLWAPQTPQALGGMGLSVVGRAVMYEEANRSIFGPWSSTAPRPTTATWTCSPASRRPPSRTNGSGRSSTGPCARPS
jgi:alkylation response protein AidB-like acyl-CoA dehydrogenase